MPEDRPAIPKHIERAILVESGHRCAVCCEPTPLERAHIIPWNKVKEHTVENLICLCANCHHRADHEPWDKKTLEEYKKNPCVTRRLNIELSQNKPMAEAEILFDTDPETFFIEQERIKAAIACFEDIQQDSIRIKVVRVNSTLAIIEMPKEAAENLVHSINNKNELLLSLLAPIKVIKAKMKTISYVGTIVGESTTREFRLAVAADAAKEQDIIAVDSEILDAEKPNESAKPIRVWAKVQSVERLNPLFPQEAGHELAETRTNPFDTVLSLSREMVTAVCQVLGYEPITGGKGKLDQLRYPPKPATMAYRPDSTDIARIVVGDLNDDKKKNRALDIATLANRPEVDVMVDGHAIVSRHLAILAMTGAGKSVTARRIIEELAKKNYPILIFDPHGDYTGLADVEELKQKVKLFRAEIPISELSLDDSVLVINGLSDEDMTPPQYDAFKKIRKASRSLLSEENLSSKETQKALFAITNNDDLNKFGLKNDLFGLAYIAETASVLAKQKDDDPNREKLTKLGFDIKTDGNVSGTFNALSRQLRRAAFALLEMEKANRQNTMKAVPLPRDRKELIKYGQIAVLSLSGYSESFKATLYSYISNYLYNARIERKIPFQFLLVLEEAHNFVPGKTEDLAIGRSISVTKKIAQEGRKFGIGLILISQRPSRLDETTLSMCNSFVIMRMVNPADQNFVRRVIESLGEDEAKNLPNLDVGEALLSGQMINFPVLVKIKEPESKGEREEKDAFATLEEAQIEILQSQRK